MLCLAEDIFRYKNKNSDITKEIFIQNIIGGLVYIALMDDDPIGYALLDKDGKML